MDTNVTPLKYEKYLFMLPLNVWVRNERLVTERMKSSLLVL